mgnify:FL=1
MKPRLNKKAEKSLKTWGIQHAHRGFNNARFHDAVRYGEEWEAHVAKMLPNKFHDYEVQHVSSVLPEGQYRLNNNKYPDFTLTNHRAKRIILIDAKRKSGYDPSRERQYVTMDESYITSYQNVQKHYEDKGYTVDGRIYFFVEMKMDLYVANDFQPHSWKKYNNHYGKEQVGIYYLDQMSKDSKVLKGWVKGPNDK